MRWLLVLSVLILLCVVSTSGAASRCKPGHVRSHYGHHLCVAAKRMPSP